MDVILDISHHQPPSALNYDKLAKEVNLVIIRTQYGSRLTDKYYKTHHKEFQKRGVPTAAYAWVRGVSVSDMEQEATDFYNRTKSFNPTFWFLDVEEKSMGNMRTGTSAYVKKLRSLGARKVGIYVAHHLYKSFNINVNEADAIWIPRYGANMPNYPCDLWQYTESGRLKGYNGPLDLSRLNGNKSLSYFIANERQSNKKDDDTLSSKEFKTLSNEIANLKKMVDRKQDIPSDNQLPGKLHIKGTNYAKSTGITDGSNPHHYLTREQYNTMLYRLHRKFLKLDTSITAEIASHFESMKPYLNKPERWKEKLENNDVEIHELLGMFMLVLLRKGEENEKLLK